MKVLLPLLASALLLSLVSAMFINYIHQDHTTDQQSDLIYEAPTKYHMYSALQDGFLQEAWEVKQIYGHVPRDVNYLVEGQIPLEHEAQSGPALGVGIQAVLGAAIDDGRIADAEEYYILKALSIEKEIVDGNVNYHFNVVFTNGAEGRIYATFTTEEDSQTGEIKAKTTRIDVAKVGQQREA